MCSEWRGVDPLKTQQNPRPLTRARSLSETKKPAKWRALKDALGPEGAGTWAQFVGV